MAIRRWLVFASLVPVGCGGDVIEAHIPATGSAAADGSDATDTESDGATGLPTQGPTDDSAGAGADSDSAAATDGSSGDGSEWDGVYVGELAIDWSVPSQGLDGVCVGEITLTLDVLRTPQIQGGAICDTEIADTDFSFVPTVEGNLGEPSGAGPSGTVLIRVGPQDVFVPWTGALEGDAFTGQFDATARIFAGELQLTGSWTGDR